MFAPATAMAIATTSTLARLAVRTRATAAATTGTRMTRHGPSVPRPRGGRGTGSGEPSFIGRVAAVAVGLALLGAVVAPGWLQSAAYGATLSQTAGVDDSPRRDGS